MKKFRYGFLAALVVMMSVTAMGQSSYTWNVASGDWTASGSWTPARTAPAVDDILIFDGATQATPIVTLVPSETIGRLRIINNAAVTFSTATATSGAGTLARTTTAVTGTTTSFTTFFSVGDYLFTGTNSNVSQISVVTSNTAITTLETGTIAAATAYFKAPKLAITGNQPGLDVAAGSSLTITSSTPVIIFLPTGATGSISGTIVFSATGHRLDCTDAGAITFNSGSTFTCNSTFVGNAFGAVGTLNALIFASGSTYKSQAGSNPFGTSAPNSKITFQTGSTFSHEQSGTPSFSGRTYANFVLNFSATFTTTGGSAVSMNDLTITLGTLNFNMTGTPGHSIKGNISVASGQTLNFAPLSAGTVNLNGTSLQTISGAGTISTIALSTIVINNSNGISLGKNISILGTLTMTQGNIALGGNTLTLGSAIGTPGTLTYTAGYITGTGSFTRWFATAAIAGNAGLFPMGVGANNRSLTIGGSPSTGGPIAVSYNNAATVSAITFSENSQSFVNRYDANWVVTPSGGYTDGAMTLTIRGDGIPGITNVADLDLSAATTIATGVYAAPSGSTSAPVLTRNGLTQGTIVTNPFYIASVNTSPLPVELTSFTAFSKGRGVELSWKTATEINNAGFEVEKAVVSNQSSAKTWTKVGYVEGHGTINAPQSYSYVDASAKGAVSYRLKQIDRDGKFEYSNTVEATVGLTAEDFTLTQNFPNPFNPNTTITFAMKNAEHVNVTVYNSLGQEVATLFNNIANPNQLYTLNFDGKNLSSGTYFYALRSASRNEVKKMNLMK